MTRRSLFPHIAGVIFVPRKRQTAAVENVASTAEEGVGDRLDERVGISCRRTRIRSLNSKSVQIGAQEPQQVSTCRLIYSTASRHDGCEMSK